LALDFLSKKGGFGMKTSATTCLNFSRLIVGRGTIRHSPGLRLTLGIAFSLKEEVGGAGSFHCVLHKLVREDTRCLFTVIQTYVKCAVAPGN
jgi:hypothetical protein